MLALTSLLLLMDLSAISFSGGSLPGFLLSSSSANYLLEQGVLTENITFATVSGGSLGYMAVTSLQLAYPSLSDAPYTSDALEGWESKSNAHVAFDLPAKALDFSGILVCIMDIILDHEPSPGCKAYAGLSSILPCLGSAIRFSVQRPVWYCAIQYLIESAGASISDMKAGPSPWHIEYTVFDKAVVPISSAGPQPNPALLKDRISVSTMFVRDGTEPTFTDSSNFRAKGTHGFDPLHPLQIELSDAITYSTSFFSIDTMFKGKDGERCSFTGDQVVDRILDANYQVNGHLSLSSFLRGVATDGGAADLMGLIPLLRQKMRNILTFYVMPMRVDYSPLPNLFGVNATNISAMLPFDCKGSVLDMIGTTVQVFPSSLWAETSAQMNSLHNTGVTILRDVDVVANPAIGVEAYHIDHLMIVDNQRKTAFERSVLAGADIDSLVAQGYPLGGAFNVPKPVGVAMSLLTQWKLEQNIDTIRNALHG